MKKSLIVFAVAGCGLLAPALVNAQAPFLQIRGYLQPRMDAVISSDGLATDMFVRRFRLMATGKVTDDIGYFAGFLVPNIGRDGNDRVMPLIADAWIEYALLSPELSLHAGVMRMPFSRHSAQGGGTLHGIDFHMDLLRRRGPLPLITPEGPEPRLPLPQRDLGIMARGLLLGGSFQYRLAIADGVSPHEGGAWPRAVGRVAVNVLDPEPDFHLKGTYLGKKRVLSFGASFDVEPEVGGADGDALYYALAFDALADIPFGKGGFTSTLAAYYYGPGGAMAEGAGFFADAGVRIHEYEPLVEVEFYQPRFGDEGKLLGFFGGFNWWIEGHAANLKLRAGAEKRGGAAAYQTRVEMQAQVLF